MRRSARNQNLPSTEVENLLSLSGNELKARCYNLYQAGWTLAAIGAPLNKARSTIRSWVTSGPYNKQDVPVPDDRSYIPKKPQNPGISPAEADTIRRLAPQARKYRAKLPEGHAATIANRKLTNLCVSLNQKGVPLQDLADVAGVTYRAMYRRVRNVR
jgi:hypothetical protein